MERGVPLSRLKDNVVATGALDRIKLSLLGIPLELVAYRNILISLGVVGGYADETLGISGAVNYGTDHFTCFQFPYDWRRDNSENAQLLHEFILAKRKYVQTELARRYGTHNVDVHFDIVGSFHGWPAGALLCGIRGAAAAGRWFAPAYNMGWRALR